MISIHDFEKISDFEWRILQHFHPQMRTAVRVFATRRLLEAALGDKSIEQAVNAAMLPGLVGEVLVMPDVHQGYGFPIGGVAATRYPQGVISPGGIGYDINCGVRLMASRIQMEDALPHLDDLATALNQHCPSGVGTDGNVNLSASQLERVCREGSRYALQNGMATPMDVQRTEEGGCLAGADPAKLSSRARERGRSQLGSLGAGNHFLEVAVVEKIFDWQAADIMGLKYVCLTFMIH